MKLDYLKNQSYGYVIELFKDEHFEGFLGRYIDLSIEIYGQDKAQLLNNLKLAKDEYFLTCIKENTLDRIPKSTMIDMNHEICVEELITYLKEKLININNLVFISQN